MKYDHGIYSKEQFKDILYNDLKVSPSPILDSKLNQPNLKFSQLMKFIDKNDKYPLTKYKPNHIDPNKINIPAFTPSLTSFQQRNISIRDWDNKERFPEKKELLNTIKGVLDGQVNSDVLEWKLTEMDINNEVMININFENIISID